MYIKSDVLMSKCLSLSLFQDIYSNKYIMFVLLVIYCPLFQLGYLVHPLVFGSCAYACPLFYLSNQPHACRSGNQQRFGPLWPHGFYCTDSFLYRSGYSTPHIHPTISLPSPESLQISFLMRKHESFSL